jgi:hypothetical protein
MKGKPSLLIEKEIGCDEENIWMGWRGNSPGM